jgi:hypothetical protein
MMMLERIFFFFLYLLWTVLINAKLDVSWIPSDPDGPLPLSSRYRSALQLLCKQIHSGQKLSPEIAAKKAVLQKMCIKLQESNSISIANPFENLPIQKLLVSFIVIGGGTYYAWTQRRALYRFFRRKALSIRGGQVVGSEAYSTTGGGGDGGDGHGGPTSTSTSTFANNNNNNIKEPVIQQQIQPKQSKGLLDMAAIREARMRHFASSSLPTTAVQ